MGLFYSDWSQIITCNSASSASNSSITSSNSSRSSSNSYSCDDTFESLTSLKSYEYLQ